MRKIVLLLTLVICSTLVVAPAIAAGGYDVCRQEESRLRAAEAEQCSGMGYIFNPSACFNTRKALVPYGKGKCRAIAAGEGESGVGAEPVKPAEGAAMVGEARQPVRQTPVATTPPPTELEQLRQDVDELKTALKRLQEEMARLKGAR